MTRAHRQTGFAYIAAIVLLVVLAGMAVAMLRLTTTQQSTVNQALLGAKASLAARGGLEWAFHTMNANCPAEPAVATIQRTEFRPDSGFHVTVTCSFRDYNEGQRMAPPPPGGAASQTSTPQVKRIFRITATACNGSGGTCPDAGSVTGADYVERARTATLCVIPIANPGGSFSGCET